MVKLKPCPFCGGTDIRIDAIPSIAQFYRCERCKAKGPYWTADGGAKEKWNTRATDPLIEELAEKIADRYCKDELLKEMAEALEKLSRLGNEPYLGSSIGNLIAQEALKKYHEQIGELK